MLQYELDIFEYVVTNKHFILTKRNSNTHVTDTCFHFWHLIKD